MSSLRLSSISALRACLVIAVAALTCLGFSQTVLAADTVLSSTYQDSDGNGTVNRVRWLMDETVTACAYEAGDWTVNEASELGLTITGLTCTGSDANLYITISADANETGHITTPEISYANAGTLGSVTLTSGAMTAKANKSLVDTAAPTVVSTTPTSGSAGVSVSTDIVITFSERMDAPFDEGTEFSVTPDPGAFTETWAISEDIVTLSFPNLVCGTTYTVATDEAEITASSGTELVLITTGSQDGDWTFTTGSCGGGAATPVSVSSFTYDGPNCALENAQSFSVTGSNIAAYLASADSYFSDADWVTDAVQGSDSFDVVLAGDASTAYLALKSTSGVASNVYSFALDNWDLTCVSSTDDANDATDTSDDATTDDDSANDTNVPVAGLSPGDVVHSSTSSAVYYVTSTYGRRAFINEPTYFTWFESFDVVKEIDSATLAALPLEGSMLPKAGVVLVKIQSSPIVYFLDDENADLTPELREIRDEVTATTLFGNNWADYVIDVEPTFFTKFGNGLDVEADEDLGVDVTDMKQREDLHD